MALGMLGINIVLFLHFTENSARKKLSMTFGSFSVNKVHLDGINFNKANPQQFLPDARKSAKFGGSTKQIYARHKCLLLTLFSFDDTY